MGDPVMQFYALCPIVATERLAFVSLPERGRRPRTEPVCFTDMIYWLRHCHASVVYRHGGQLISVDQIYTDYYGMMTGYDLAVDHAMDSCAKFHVDGTSTLEVAVLLQIVDTPVQPAGLPRQGRRRSWNTLPPDVYCHDEQLLEEYCQAADKKARDVIQRRMRRPQSIVHVNDLLVWTSMASENEKPLLAPIEHLILPPDNPATNPVRCT